jgi:hypothetical protein
MSAGFATDVSGGRIRMTRTKLIVGLITPHHTYLAIMKTCKGRPKPNPGCSATDDDDDELCRKEAQINENHGCLTNAIYCKDQSPSSNIPPSLARVQIRSV